MGISVESYREQLRQEGFERVYLWRDRPGATQAPHFHTSDTVQIVIDGEMTLNLGGQSRVLGWGERAFVAAGAMHASKAGPQGCIFLVGERRPG
jgi:quercetin dioxygenase-like cupin family protein